jgi:hypothetical protein
MEQKITSTTPQHNRKHNRTMTKKSPPVTVTERTWLTKRPYKRQKKSNMPAPAPQAAAPAEEPVPVPPLVTADNDVARAPVEKKSPPVLPAAPAVAPAPLFVWGAHPSEWYFCQDCKDGDELPGPLVQGARDLRRGVEGGHCGAPP